MAPVGGKKHEFKPSGGGGDLLDDEEEKVDWKGMFLQERTVGEPQNIPQSVIYELVNETINVGATTITLPQGDPKTGKCSPKQWFWYLFKMPLTYTQFFTILDHLSKRNETYYPLSIPSFDPVLGPLDLSVHLPDRLVHLDVTVAIGLKLNIIPYSSTEVR